MVVHGVFVLYGFEAQGDKVKEQLQQYHKDKDDVEDMIMVLFSSLMLPCIYKSISPDDYMNIINVTYVTIYSPRSSHSKKSVITMSNLTILVCIIETWKQYKRSSAIQNAY